MLSAEDIQKIQEQSIEWLNTNILGVDFALQIAVILVAFGAGLIGHKMARPWIQDKINSLKIPFKAAEVLRNISKLILPFIALLIMLMGTAIFGGMEMDNGFSDAVSKLLMAWIGIKIIVQFIQNTFMRQSASLIIWGIAALSIFGVLDETSAALDSLGVTIGDFRISALSITKGVLALFALIYIATLLANLADRQINKISSLKPSSRVLITKISRVFLIVSAVLIGVTTAGIDLSLLAVFSGAVGLGIGFGLQKVISNLFSGMLLLLDESIKPGDIIELPGADGGATFGWVNHMGARYTEIVTRDNKSFLVPNEDFITQQVVNWSHGNTLVRVQTTFGVHYDSDPREVKRLAEEAVLTVQERVVENPAPVCWLIEFGDSSLNFTLRYWIKDAEKGVTNTKGMVMMALWEKFKENGILIPYPHREVFLHEAPKPTKKSAA
ncbi:MAG: mechanosensitive ion channel domain-containing protein [Pseudomonadota bacterium]